MAKGKADKSNTVKKDAAEHAEQERTTKAKARVIEQLEKTLGIVTTACKRANVSRSQFYKWYAEDSEFKAAVDDSGEIALDFAETQLLSQIRDNNPASTIFYLKTKGKKRGYVEKTEVQHGFGDGGVPEFKISIRRNHPDKAE